jgi:hypothetical protein
MACSPCMALPRAVCSHAMQQPQLAPPRAAVRHASARLEAQPVLPLVACLHVKTRTELSLDWMMLLRACLLLDPWTRWRNRTRRTRRARSLFLACPLMGPSTQRAHQRVLLLPARRTCPLMMACCPLLLRRLCPQSPGQRHRSPPRQRQLLPRPKLHRLFRLLLLFPRRLVQ